jgi:hypothetical protein
VVLTRNQAGWSSVAFRWQVVPMPAYGFAAVKRQPRWHDVLSVPEGRLTLASPVFN